MGVFAVHGIGEFPVEDLQGSFFVAQIHCPFRGQDQKVFLAVGKLIDLQEKINRARAQEVIIMIFDRVKDIIADKLSVDVEEITMESSFIDDLGADSLDIVELVMALEDEFDLEIPDEDAEKIATVGDVVEYIKAHSEE